MVWDHPDLSRAEGQPTPQQPLVLPEYPEKAQRPFPGMQQRVRQPFPDAQPTLMDNTGQPFSGMQQPFPDMEQTFAQAQYPFLEPQVSQQPPTQAYQSRFTYTGKRPLYPGYLIRSQRSSQPVSPLAKLTYLWRSDPAYKVFIIAVTTVLLSGIICIMLISNLFKQSSSSSQASQGPAVHQTTEVNASTATKVPTPTALPTPTAIPTPTIEPTTPPIPVAPPVAPPTSPVEQLAVEITSISPVVLNNTSVSVRVAANQPGVYVSLSVAYSGATPSSFSSNVGKTNGDGQETLLWRVSVDPFKKSSRVTARVTAIAQDANGQTAVSQAVTVQVITFRTD